jgi:ribosome-binding factor A
MAPCRAREHEAASSVAPIFPIWVLPASLPRALLRTPSPGDRLVTGSRNRRVNEAIRQVLSDAVPTLKDPRIGFVTITGVQATKDFAYATVYVSVFGSEDEQRRTLEGLEAAHGVLQAQVARELRLRRTPVLTFEYDPTVERGVRLGKMIDELAPEEADGDEG